MLVRWAGRAYRNLVEISDRKREFLGDSGVDSWERSIKIGCKIYAMY